MIHNIYPVLMTGKLHESNLFYQAYFGFGVTFSSDWYVSLLHPDGSELALIDACHSTIPESCRRVVRGMIINIEVDDASKAYQEIFEKNETVLVTPLCDEDYGQRHFMLQDPNGILIDVIEAIPPAGVYEDSDKTGELL